MKTYIVTGAGGQLGQCFRAIAPEFPEVQLYYPSRSELDILDLENLKTYCAAHPSDGILNCAAYTGVDAAEEAPEEAKAVNVTGVENLVAVCQANGMQFIHFSTDYVFDGTQNQPYTETGPIQPKGVYGETKAAGEQVVLATEIASVIIRTSWLFSAYGNNFVKAIAGYAADNETLSVVDDQWGRPTYGMDLARATLQLLQHPEGFNYKIYHYANSGKTTWFALAAEIVKQLGLACEVTPIPTSAYPALATRPQYSVFDTRRIETLLETKPRPWENALSACLKEG